MINLAKTVGRTSSGVLFLQKYGKGWRYRLSLDCLKRAGLPVKESQKQVFESIPCGILQSEVFETLSEGQSRLIDVLYTLTGQRCIVE